MSTPKETTSEETRTVSPSCVKRERVEDDEATRRVAQRTETAQETEETEEELEEISEKTMIKIVMNDLWSNNERTRELAMKQLVKYLYEEDDEKMAEKQDAFFQVGGHLATVRVMKEHPNCKILQSGGLVVLMNATYKNASVETAVAKVEGIPAILAAMKKFSSDEDVIQEGFGALANIVNENEANANLLVMELGGIPFLVEQMKEFQGDANVTYDACDMLESLSSFEHLRKVMVDAKAATALANAIERHGDNPDIQKLARKAMKQLL
jgi:hypothetical protein